MQEETIKFETANLAESKGYKFEYIGTTLVNIPTQSLLQKWIREVHNIHIGIIWKEKGFDFTIKTDPNRILNPTLKLYATFENALEEALIESLKLIK